MKNPYAASHTKDSEILPTEWPLVTTRQLADALKNEARYEASEINQGIHTLILARKAIGDAKLACARASKVNTREDVKERLGSLIQTLDALTDLLPLTLIETRGRRTRLEPEPVLEKRPRLRQLFGPDGDSEELLKSVRS